MTAFAAAATRTRTDAVARRFHALRTQGKDAPDPDRETVDAFLEKAEYRLRNDPSISLARSQRALSHLQAAHGAALPDGATFHAWQNLQSDLDAARVSSGDPVPFRVPAADLTMAARDLSVENPREMERLLNDGLDDARFSRDPQDLADVARRQQAKRQVVEVLSARMAHVPDEELLSKQTQAELADTDATVWAPTKDGGWMVDRGGEPGRAGRVARDDPALRAGLRQAAVSDLVARWAVTSNGQDPEALAMQACAEQEFGLVGSAEWRTTPQLREEVSRRVTDQGQVYRAFLRAQYDQTQAEFTQRGITHIRLYRGFTWDGPEDVPDWAQDNSDKPLPLRPLSSCSSSFGVAVSFTGGGGLEPSERDRTLVEATVPVSRVLSTPRSGVGCLNEQEMVVLSGPGAWRVETALAGEGGAGAEPDFDGISDDDEEDNPW